MSQIEFFIDIGLYAYYHEWIDIHVDFLFSLRGLVNTKEATLPENISAKKN